MPKLIIHVLGMNVMLLHCHSFRVTLKFTKIYSLKPATVYKLLVSYFGRPYANLVARRHLISPH